MKEWKNELGTDLKNFKRQSEQVLTWDNQLRENWGTWNEILGLYEHVLSNDHELKRMCDSIEEYQNELDNNLLQLEEAVRREMDSPHAVFVQQDNDRYFVYQESELLAADLLSMEDKLERLVESFNRAREPAAKGEDGNPTSKIVAVLNQHFDQLAALQRKTNELDRSIKSIYANPSGPPQLQ